MTNLRTSFKLALLNTKIRNLVSNGYQEYLNTWEPITVHGDTDMNHIIMTCTKGHYNGSVCDIYYNERTGQAWLEYSGQFVDNSAVC